MLFKITTLIILTLVTLRFALIATWTNSNKATDRFVLSLVPTLTMWLMIMEVIQVEDRKLDELIKEVHRCETIFNECEPAASLAAILDLRAAEERLDLYFKERRLEDNVGTDN